MKMHVLAIFWQRIFLATCAVWLLESAVFAQNTATAPAPGKSYVLAYALVVLCVLLGLVVVCRPGRRSSEPKLPDLE